MSATNRPTYAPERRAGDPLNDLAGNNLVAFHFDRRDAITIAALLEAGAAALKYAPARVTNVVELNARQRDYRLGSTVARALRTEADRRRATLEAGHKAATRRARR